MTVKITLTTTDGRKLVQCFAGCTDPEHGKAKARKIFPGCKITKAEELMEKKK